MAANTRIDAPGTESRIAAILRADGAREVAERLANTGRLTSTRALVVATKTDEVAHHLRKALAPSVHEAFFDANRVSEAIILEKLRPALLVRNGLFETAEVPEVEAAIKGFRSKMKKPIASVGRIELTDHDTYEWCGTGWRVDEDLIITNRHVANIFARRYGREFRFSANQAGKIVRARVDFLEEYSGADSQEFGIAKILWIADDADGAPDMAVLQIKKDPGLPPPLELASQPVVGRQDIAVVGYPAKDSRNDDVLMQSIFKDIYDVKRFAPGKVAQPGGNAWYFTHDATTLGGNSGSAVFDLASGKVVGLHFGGSFRQTNYAVKAEVIRSIIARRSWVPVSPGALRVPAEGFSETKRTVAQLADRQGYQDDFLGVAVLLPTPGRSHAVLKVPFPKQALPYTHYSVVMSEPRRLAIFSAENLDGALKIKLKRKDSWGYDPRIPKSAQIGHKEFYGPQAFDKGHMAKRENGGWGRSEAEAQQGEDDTFVYPNAVPQMPQLNQQTWKALEDYVLDNARTAGFKVCVFTGPVFRPGDPAYTDSQLQVPVDFWKVVVTLDADAPTRLLTTAYLLSQESVMPEESFRFGAFRTYQVPLAHVEQLADLTFSAEVRAADVFSASEVQEMVASQRFVEIRSADDVVLTRNRNSK
ncbi:DNA/RNA non-specific endonuclease [Hymenobacter sp. 15J16-1T3B]|uniref:DNA/RNA non-specific endonuclease n=1 Tax=Hymenobacter sp. 15J16-1T3B TaxID=2886941 RepID=UPI001D103696|nr:DNA/RNA non-specific endonuclease [Hymenobacter sp. 15J16-1T3B]MCC3155992.1 DNA/RNA non-specific endonuclease [Hymenobacter sp. 15J16-1T3B]